MTVARETIWGRLRGVFVDIFEDDELELTAATTAGDVDGWDSLSNVELMVAIEKEFGIRFHTGEMAGLADVGQLVERIEAHLD